MMHVREVSIMAKAILEPNGIEVSALNPHLPKAFKQVNKRMYLQKLKKDSLTATRDMLLDILSHAEGNRFATKELATEVKRGLQVNDEHQVSDEELLGVINMVCEV